MVWRRKHIIHTQNNCIKITLGIWLKLTKPRKLRIKAENMSLTHPPRAWYGSSCGTSDRLAAALAASGWAVLPSPLPGRKRGCTSTAAPPPPGSNSPPLGRGALVWSGKVWGWSVMPLFSARLYLQSRVSSPVASITVVRANAAKKATQTEEEFVRCVVRGETWAGRANPCGAWLWPALDLLWLIKVPQPERNAAGAVTAGSRRGWHSAAEAGWR